jgi:stage III sporulation protein AD
MVGIAYLTELGAQLIRDTGQESLALKVELAGKILILYLTIPILTNVINKIVSFFPN